MLRTADDISLLTLPSAKPAEDVSNQYHLSNLGNYSLNVQGVWADYNGAGVVVGVVDVGVQATHPDLDANYDSNLDYDIVLNTNDGTNKFTDDWHGTAVAGVIAAEDNGSGTQGVAYGAHITSFRFLDQNHGGRVDSIDDDVIDAIQ